MAPPAGVEEFEFELLLAANAAAAAAAAMAPSAACPRNEGSSTFCMKVHSACVPSPRS